MRIADAAKRAGVTVQVGHIERFNPAIRAMDRLGIQPRFIEVTRISPMTFRSIDVGVVLDMMIHDIDIVLRLARLQGRAGRRHRRQRHRRSRGHLQRPPHLRERLRGERHRVAGWRSRPNGKLRVFSPDAYVSLDYQKRYGMVARRSGNLDAIRDGRRPHPLRGGRRTCRS